jgi:heavy metal translocating P-type ATPase
MSDFISDDLKLCSHCGQVVVRPLRVDHADDWQFCCYGCRSVYHLLQSSGLSQFYSLRRCVGSEGTGMPGQSSTEFLFLDETDSDFFETDGDRRRARFFVDGMHCAACIWLIERLSVLVAGVDSVKVDFGHSIVDIRLKAEGRFSDCADMLSQLGYRVIPLRVGETSFAAESKEQRSLLLKIGVAAFASGNIMMLSISQYSGAGGQVGQWFSWISLLLCIPVMGFSAIPFYRGAWASLRTLSISTDLTVVFASMTGFLLSIYYTVLGLPFVYYDSISSFIFLLLLTRYMLKRMYQKYAYQGRLQSKIIPDFTLKLSPMGDFEPMHISAVHEGDILKVESEAIIPCDGHLLSDSAYVDTHILTGEWQSEKLSIGQTVYAGTLNTGHSFEMKVSHSGDATRLSHILNSLKDDLKPPAVLIADRVAKWFLVVTLLVSVGVFSYWFTKGDMPTAISHMLALVMVACPCALALCTPLIYALAGHALGREGIVLRKSDVLSRLRKVRHVCFDKTGTLTMGTMTVCRFSVLSAFDYDWHSIIMSLQDSISHPISVALRQYCLGQGASVLPVEGKQYTISHGVEGIVFGHQFVMTSLPPEFRLDTPSSTGIGLYCDTELVIAIELNDAIRPDALACVNELRKMGIDSTILSGDRSYSPQEVGKLVGISSVFSGVSPEQKSDFIEKYPYSMMIGDGANDALAMAKSWVSIAVHGSLDIGLRSSDIYLSTVKLDAITRLLGYSKKIHITVWSALVISLFYNAIGIFLVLNGMISPMIAAILMPFSSISVLLISVFGSQLRA